MSCAVYRIDPFREAFPAFSSATAWPDEVLILALDEADSETGGKRWGAYQNCPKNFKRRGMFLYAAHWLATNYPTGAANQAAQSGALKQVVASKSVGDESVSYATVMPSNVGAGDAWLMSTAYGQQFLRLRRRAGMGAMAL